MTDPATSPATGQTSAIADARQNVLTAIESIDLRLYHAATMHLHRAAHNLSYAAKDPPQPPAPPVNGRDASRYMDEIDAARSGSDWLEPIAKALPKHPSNEITCEKVGNDGSVRLLWHKDIIQAGFLLLRDDANFTQLLHFQADAILALSPPVTTDRAAAIEECAKIAHQTEMRCVREKISGDSAARFIATKIRALLNSK